MQLGIFSGKIHRYQKVTSTNDLAIAAAEAGADEGTVIIADEQTRGRGKLKRRWYSEAGSGLYLSLILRPRLAAEKVMLLTLLAAVAVAETLMDLLQGGAAVDIKWPNDVLINGKKVCGILSEVALRPTAADGQDAVSYAVVGIGINLNQERFPEELSQTATSLFLETGRRFQKEQFLACLLRRLNAWYSEFKAGAPGQIEKLIERWSELSSYAQGKHVWMEHRGRIVSGVTRGLAPNGALVLETANGRLEEIIAGDIFTA